MDDSGFAAFDQLTAVFAATRDALAASVGARGLSAGEAEVLATKSLPFVEAVELGLRTLLRPAELQVSQARALLAAAGIGRQQRPPSTASRAAAAAEQLAEARFAAQRGLSLAPRLTLIGPDTIEAIGHARLAFALIPAMPPSRISYPAARLSYADVHAPTDLDAIFGRVNELERVLWAVATTRPEMPEAGLRRTYAFFETSFYLRTNGLAGFELI